MNYKTVFFPITVPNNDFCWDGHHVCEYFDNEGGNPTCALGFNNTKASPFDTDVKKDPKCEELRESWE